MTTDGYFSGADELLQWAEEIDVLDMTGPEASTASTTNSDASVDYDDVVPPRKRQATDAEAENAMDSHKAAPSDADHSVEAKRLKRVMANRASAKRSRLRRLREQERAAQESEELRRQHTQLQASYKAVCAENKLLREQVTFLQSLIRRNNSSDALSLSTIAILQGKKPPLIPMTVDQVSCGSETDSADVRQNVAMFDTGKGAVLLAVFCCFSFNGYWLPSRGDADIIESEQSGLGMSFRLLEIAAAYLLVIGVLCLNRKKLWGR